MLMPISVQLTTGQRSLLNGFSSQSGRIMSVQRATTHLALKAQY